MKTIAETAIEDGRFTMLVEALEAAGLVDTLKGEGPFTVFAPTDDAFQRLPAGAVPQMMKDISALKDVLTYHVVPGKVMASDVVKLRDARTVHGRSLNVKRSDGTVMINDARVIATDIQASNGVIHVIDKVLMPPD
ncbi:MAG: fasciclin domain-containing protein [Chloroflexi bacterium]|nr:MAG: fasciclin domain-containing protein [Chloroflexota bacterium]RLC92841.1 MAG: fasciclin domain-containing protein [Chloroflexota bacterium]